MIALRSTVLVFALAALACVRPAEAPASAPAAQPSSRSNAPSALAASFAPELVGTLAPHTPSAGEYAMSLTLRFRTFITTEQSVSENRKSAFRLTLALDGSARACMGVRSKQIVNGQRRYEPAERRQYHEQDDLRLMAFAGKWKNVDGVATIDFDHVGWNSCDVDKAKSAPLHATQLRCVAVASNDRLPAALACEASERSDLLEVGLPLSRSPAPQPDDQAPRGRNIILGAPGVTVDVEQERTDVATFAFRAAPVTLVEAEYLAKP